MFFKVDQSFSMNHRSFYYHDTVINNLWRYQENLLLGTSQILTCFYHTDFLVYMESETRIWIFKYQHHHCELSPLRLASEQRFDSQMTFSKGSPLSNHSIWIQIPFFLLSQVDESRDCSHQDHHFCSYFEWNPSEAQLSMVTHPGISTNQQNGEAQN